MEDEHRRQMTELEQNLADAKRQHTKAGLELSFCHCSKAVRLDSVYLL